jgi:hypothetical protein
LSRRAVMRHSGLFGLLFAMAVAVSAALAGCGEEPVPVSPDLEQDVRPILYARCVRCHGAGGTLNGDPGHDKPANGYFTRLDDSPECALPADQQLGCQRGILSEATTIAAYLTRAARRDRMPPPPAPSLTSRETEIITRWAELNPPPE